MVFSSLIFLSVFLPLFFAVYFAAPRGYKNLVLFIGSLIFYAWGEPIYVVLMLFSTVVDYTNGRLIEKNRDKPHLKRLLLIFSVIINLGMLGFFKYADFLILNINSLFGAAIPILNLPLPIGISFYTFQTMSYSIDVYRGNTPVQKNIINFGAYVAMFPQLIAGPIVRYVSVQRELDSRRENFDDFADGVTRFIIGMAKKVLIANSVGALWDSVKVLPTGSLPAATAWIGIIAFTLQIYFDFSGYSDMAIGLGKMLGFEFPKNFDYPYISKSCTEFWRRWHMTLGTWFREYVYIPLGGNRVSAAKNIRNLLIVWLLTGFWHGASWNFLLWGGYFGVLLIGEKYLWGKALAKLPKFFQHLLTLVLVVISWVLFEAVELSWGISFLGSMFGAGGAVATDSSVYLLLSNGIVLALGIFFATPVAAKLSLVIGRRFPKLHKFAKPAILLFLLVLSFAYVVDSSYNPFLYFRF